MNVLSLLMYLSCMCVYLIIAGSLMFVGGNYLLESFGYAHYFTEYDAIFLACIAIWIRMIIDLAEDDYE